MTDVDSVLVRTARRDDLGNVAAIELKCFSSDPWPRQSFESMLDQRHVTFLIAEDETEPGEIAGYAILLRAADEAELLNLAVSPERRRRGVARALLQSLLDTAAQNGAATVYLEVRESNEPARRLYGSHGFVEVGRRGRYYERPVEDALILQRVNR